MDQEHAGPPPATRRRGADQRGPTGRTGSPSPAEALRRLQTMTGNAAASRALAQRSASASLMSGNVAVQRVPMTRQDVTTKLNAYRQTVTDVPLQGLLDDILLMLPTIQLGLDGPGAEPEAARVGRPGNTDRPSGGGGTYRDPVGNYRMLLPPQSTEQDQVALLVHELTHVLNFQGYPGAPTDTPVAATHTTAQFQSYIKEQVIELKKLLPDSGMPPGWIAASQEKLMIYTPSNPTREYDSVLSHLLVWSEQYGNTRSGYHLRLGQLVDESRGWRANGGATPNPRNTPQRNQDRLDRHQGAGRRPVVNQLITKLGNLLP